MTRVEAGISASQLREWDQRYCWHPFTPHSEYFAHDGLMIVAGDGHWLIDAEGRRYLDGVGSLWCNLFGHRRAELDAAVTAQLGRIAHATFLGNATAPAVVLAKRLVEVAPPGLARVFYSDNGSTAVEVALKLALQFWQQQPDAGARRRTKFLTFDNAYHGDTIGAVSLGGIPLFHERYGPLLFDAIRAPSPYAYRCPLAAGCAGTCGGGCVAALERLVAAHGDELAAIVLEPGVQGAAGMVVQPPGFVRRVRELADAAGTLLILDEVAVGFGRSGALFASGREGVTPDLLCLAKGITGGYLPLAATLATERIFEAFLGAPAAGRTFFHGHTYTANPLAAAAALATLDVFAETALLDELPRKAARLAELLAPLAAHPAVGDIRQYGLAVGIELVHDRRTKAPYPAAERRGMAACRAARAHGVFLRPLGDVLVLMPPLTLSDAELVHLTAAVQAAVEATCADAAG